MTDIQYGSTIIGEREVSRPYGVGFSPKASGFYPFTDATDLVIGRRWCCGVADSSLSLEPQTKGTVLLVCGFVVCLKSDMPQHQRQVRNTGIGKRLFFLCFLFHPPVFFH